jgi:hypothetical protein
MTGYQYIYSRQMILEIATGERQPISKCGINRMMKELYTLFPVPTYTCQADREKQLHAQIKTHA